MCICKAKATKNIHIAFKKERGFNMKEIQIINPYDRYNDKNEYYCAKMIIESLVSFLQKYRPEKEQIPENVYNLIRLYLYDEGFGTKNKTKVDNIIDKIAKKDISSEIPIKYEIFKTYAIDTQRNVMATILAHNSAEVIQNIINEKIKKKKEEDIIEKKKEADEFTKKATTILNKSNRDDDEENEWTFTPF